MMQAGLGAFAPNAVGAAPPMPPVPTQPGGIAPLPDPLEQLLEQSRMVKQINAERAGEGQQAGAQMAQGMPTVKEQIDRALGAAPYNFAGGGIVAFADGGDLGSGDLSLEDILSADLDGIQADEFSGFTTDPIALTMDRLRVENAPRLDRIRELERQIKELQDRNPSNTRLPALIAELNALKASAAPTVILPTGPARPTAQTPAATTPATTTPAATTPAVTPARPASPASATPGVQPSPSARSDGLGDAFNAYRREKEALADLVRSQSGTPDEVLEAQRRYDTATSGMLKGEEDALAEMEAAAKANVFDNDEILAGILAGMQGTDRLGETLLGAATGAARGRASQKKAIAEAKKDLNKLRRDLAMKQAELQLARKEGDVNRARTAAVEVQKIKVAIEDKSMEQKLKEVDAETRRIAANASMTSAQQRGTTSDFQIDKLVRQAIADVQKRIFIPSGLKPGPPRDRLVKQQIDDVVAQVGPLGVTREQVMGYFGAPATAPGASRVIDFTSIK